MVLRVRPARAMDSRFRGHDIVFALLVLLSLPTFAQQLPLDALTTVTNPAFPVPTPPPVQRVIPMLERADVAPYFAEGTLAQAKAAFDSGDVTKARTLLEGAPESPPVRYLRALAAYQLEDNDFAAREFEALASTYTVMRARCLVYAGWAYEALKNWDAAQRCFQGVEVGSRVYPDARLGLSRALKQKKSYDAAKKAIAELADKPAPAWGRDVGAEALLTLADLAAFRGDTKSEQAALVALWTKHPMSLQAPKAEARLPRPGVSDPDAGVETPADPDAGVDLAAIPPEALIARAENLVEAHQNAEGLALVQPFAESLKLPDPLACKANFVAAKALRKLRKHSDAIAMLIPVVQKCKDPELKVKALYTLSYCRSVASPSTTVVSVDQLLREFPDNALADDVAIYGAEVQFKLGNTNDAVNRLITLVQKYPQSDSANDALFKLFWLHFQEKNPDATVFLDLLEARNRNADDTYEVERAAYWRTRAMELQGDLAGAIPRYQQASLEHPATYYGLISREALQRLDAGTPEETLPTTSVAPAAKDPFPMPLGALAGNPQFLQAVELLRLGLNDLVPMEIVSMDRSSLNAESLRVLVHLLALSGDQRAAHGMARLWLRRDLAGTITPENRSIWEIAYPKVFRELIDTHCGAADGLDSDLLQGLMREESALDPKALSWAGAMGLCQLMPATAAGVAMQLRLKRPSTSQLLEPELNIQLGSRYLADLVKRQGGIAQYAIASYNAGEGAIARWKGESPGDLDSWVEQIPIQETRGYVKRVLRSYNTYKLLYAPGQVLKTKLELKPAKPQKKAAP